MVGEHQKEGFGWVAAAQKVDPLGGDPTGGVEHFIVHPGPGHIAVTANASINVIDFVLPQLFA
jgi:hypothetical protein